MNPNKMAEKYRALIKERMPVITTAHDEKSHGYVSPTTKERYKSTTYFTAIIKDPSIALFKMNRALDYISLHYKELTAENIEEHIKKAKLVPQDVFETAGDHGSQAHAWREKWFKRWIDSGEGSLPDSAIDNYPLPETPDIEVISACRAIKKFLKETGAIPVFCEVPLVDDDLKLGGQADDGFIFPNPKKVPTTNTSPELQGGYKIKYRSYFAFVDLKTSSQGKKPAYAYQVRGIYQRMFVKTFKLRPKKTYILHTSKINGTYDLIDLTDMKFLEKDAQMLVHLSRSWDRVVEHFKPKTLMI